MKSRHDHLLAVDERCGEVTAERSARRAGPPRRRRVRRPSAGRGRVGARRRPRARTGRRTANTQTVADRRYGTAAWKRTRRVVLGRDGYTCQVGAPAARPAPPPCISSSRRSSTPNCSSGSTTCKPPAGLATAAVGFVRSDNRLNRRTIPHLETMHRRRHGDGSDGLEPATSGVTGGSGVTATAGCDPE